MSKINTIIQPQRFELIRDQIAAIIADEMQNQATLASDATLAPDVWIERFIPFDKSELPAIDIFFQNANYNENTPVTAKGENNYQIEVITAAKSTIDDDGDTLASRYCERLIGIIRTILSHPEYYKLDFAENFIYNTRISSIRMSEPRREQDGTHTTTGLLTFTVIAEEYNKETSPSTGDRITTNKALLNETEKGFKIELI